MGGFVAKIVRPKQKPSFIQRAAVKAAPAGPTVAEMDQGQIRRGRGRRATILTSSKGVDEDLTLGRKTLLG
jgi:hypothetical protein